MSIICTTRTRPRRPVKMTFWAPRDGGLISRAVDVLSEADMNPMQAATAAEASRYVRVYLDPAFPRYGLCQIS
jgi:hypothetical protein